METFYCVGCRFGYPMEKSARITAGAHRDGEPVGFCFLCARDINPDEVDGDAEESAEDTTTEAASA
jgi:hypothetical protein